MMPLTQKPHLILASASPRRLELLNSAQIVPDAVIPAEIQEIPGLREPPKMLAGRLAIEKAHAVAALRKDAYVIGADTVVAVGRRILGKPASQAEAERFLTLLSGRRHKVITGHCVIAPGGKSLTRTIETVVQFKRLIPAEIQDYLDSREWEDVAGGYAIQGRAAGFIPFIRGSYSNVVGLSLYDTMQMLSSLGYAR